jgi:hypothetical protein
MEKTPEAQQAAACLLIYNLHPVQIYGRPPADARDFAHPSELVNCALSAGIITTSGPQPCGDKKKL